ncbi:MAG: bifunctional fructose-bisphosphatase/inositol-phosphate phosphatase [Methanothrix sp.]|nr:bifunctional fructose-bisphosphatase/inositol-phosphate phosphatase [Methanothrix sp.]
MSEQLSSLGRDLKQLCDDIAGSVSSAIRELIGTTDSAQMVTIGADGTPTKKIDRIAEEAVLARLRSSGLGFSVLSEEIGRMTIGERPDHILHLDPLDGTFNAVRGIPFYSVSIFISKGDCHFGYVCDLPRGRSYYAEAGRGAYVQPGGRLYVSRTADLKEFSISAYTLRPNTERIVGIGDRVRRIRTLGSTSLEMAMVAEGVLDAFVDLRGMLRVVDVAAGKLLLEEAGGIITDARGRSLHLDGDMWMKTDLIGSNGLAHEDLLKLIGGGRH